MIALGSLVTIVVVMLTLSRNTDCQNAEQQQNKELLLKLSQTSSDPLVSTASCEMSRKVMQKQNAALMQEVHKLQNQLNDVKAQAKHTQTKLLDTQTKLKSNRQPEHTTNRKTAKKSGKGDGGKQSNGVKKHEWTTMKKEAGTIPPIYHRMHTDTSESMQKSCALFRERVPYNKRLLGVAGLFSTGTNLLSLLLDKNCEFKGRPTPLGGSMSEWGPVLWQVPSGKHNFAHWQGKFHADARYWTKGAMRREAMEYKNMMAVVVVKDPLTWIGSMCRNRYAAHGKWFRQDSCPALTHNADVTLKGYPQQGNESKHTTILDFWTEWHREYYDLDRSRIFLRFEDLLFDQANALETVCSCVGGTLANPLRGLADAVKNGTAGHQNGEQVGRDKAVERYSNAKIRLMRYTDKDLNFIRHHKSANEIMDAFGYFVPDVATATTTRGKHEPQRFANGV